MNWSALNGQHALGKALRLPLHAIPADRVVRVLSGPLRGARWVAGSLTHGVWLGTYERSKVTAFAKAVKPGCVVWDVGANVGVYALLAARRGARVFAFEPVPENVAMIERHLALNHVEAHIDRAAVSDRPGVMRFDRTHSHTTGRISESGDLEVPTVRLDDLTLPRPDVIKMDIEGGETAALHGGLELLREHRPALFLATHSPQLHIECVKLLRDVGYTLHSLDGRSVDETDELLATFGR